MRELIHIFSIFIVFYSFYHSSPPSKIIFLLPMEHFMLLSLVCICCQIITVICLKNVYVAFFLGVFFFSFVSFFVCLGGWLAGLLVLGYGVLCVEFFQHSQTSLHYFLLSIGSTEWTIIHKCCSAKGNLLFWFVLPIYF